MPRKNIISIKAKKFAENHIVIIHLDKKQCMDRVPYIDRLLRLDNQHISTDEFIDKLGVAVVLAEPGAGKTRLLEQLSELLGVPIYRASIFRHKNQIEWPDPLLIDAFDEVAKLDL